MGMGRSLRYTYLRIDNRVPVRYLTCVSVTRGPEFLEGLLASAHASAPAPHRGPGDRDPRDRVLEPTRRDPCRAGSRVGCSKDLHPGAPNGLLARGYLIEEAHRFHLGPGPFILASRANKLAALSLDHEIVAELGKALGCGVLVGVRVGDAMIFTDYAGQESPSLTFAARTHARRPLYTSAAGKILLANVPDDEMHRLLNDAGPEHAGDVPQFLTELPEIRSRQLAFNRGVTIADAYVVATPLLARDGRLIAAALLRLVRGGQTPRRGGPVRSRRRVR
jgi:IclR family acetate operon transcriptional repressor